MSRCGQCGASLPNGLKCAGLFDQLLAREFSAGSPWGPLHGVTVPAMFLQHSEDQPAHLQAARWHMLHYYRAQGLDGLLRATNSVRGKGMPDSWFAGQPPFPGGQPPTVYAYTVVDVAGTDLAFPADGHQRRVDRWIAATIEAWAGEDQPG